MLKSKDLFMGVDHNGINDASGLFLDADHNGVPDRNDPFTDLDHNGVRDNGLNDLFNNIQKSGRER